MIFDCPNCGAENGVPSSSIDPDGCLLKCRRCLKTFRVFPPEDANEHSRELVSSGQVPGSTDPESMIWTLDHPNTRIEPIPDELALKLDASRLENISEEEPPSDTDEVEVNAILNIDSNSSGLRDFSAIQSHAKLNDTEDSIETTSSDLSSDPRLNVGAILESGNSEEVIEPYGRYEDPSEASLSPISPYADVESPSHVATAGLVDGLSVRDIWGRAPLALRAALAVFPVAFFLGLAFGNPNDVSEAKEATAAEAKPTTIADLEPVVIPVISNDKAGARKADGAVSPAPADEPKKVKVHFSNDQVAPDKHAFVLPSRLRMRSRPDKKSVKTGSLRQGTLVRVYDQYEDWSLVFLPSGGPVGFVRTVYLGSRRPLNVLAKEIAFTGCSARVAGSLGACMETARSQERECLFQCGPGDNVSDLAQRCREVCAIAFGTCADSCRNKSKRSKKRRSKRR